MELESQGWKGLQGTSIHANNIQGAFYAQLMKEFAVSGNASVYELYFNDTLVASRLCIFNSEMLIILKTTYAEEFSEYAPGRLLLYAVIEREFAQKRVKKIEFYTNANQDQISWSTEQRYIQHITLFRHSLLKKAYQAKNVIRGKI
ncbi:GNAT family N-acetyltransferase [Chromatium okenii]|nr:GNAT family N-acetyltransferase [Chromatium okenii]